MADVNETLEEETDEKTLETEEIPDLIDDIDDGCLFSDSEIPEIPDEGEFEDEEELNLNLDIPEDLEIPQWEGDMEEISEVPEEQDLDRLLRETSENSDELEQMFIEQDEETDDTQDDSEHLKELEQMLAELNRETEENSDETPENSQYKKILKLSNRHQILPTIDNQKKKGLLKL